MSDVLVLCYHAVSRSWPAALSVTPDRLQRQLASLLARGYEGATFHDALVHPTAERTLAVTFDDAYRSVIEFAHPILHELGIPGTVFVPTAHPGRTEPMSWPGIDGWIGGPYEPELMPMSWEELGLLAAQGWEIGSHTRTHPHLPELEPEALRAELEGSRADCETHLGAPCRSLAYPFGDYDDAVVEAAGRAGYTTAGALAGRVRSPSALCWPRVGVYHVDGRIRFELKSSARVRALQATRAWKLRLMLRRGQR